LPLFRGIAVLIPPGSCYIHALVSKAVTLLGDGRQRLVRATSRSLGLETSFMAIPVLPTMTAKEGKQGQGNETAWGASWEEQLSGFA
jgi:hypothetical protein